MPFDESLIEWDKPTTGFDPSLIKWDEEKPSIDTEVQSGEALPGYETPEPLTWADRWQRFKESLGGGPITLPEIPKAAGPYLGQLMLGPAKDIVPPSIKSEYVDPLAHTLATAGKGMAEFTLTPEGALATAATVAQPELAPYIWGGIGASQIPSLPEREAQYAEQTLSKDPYERMRGWFGAITDPLMTGLMTSGAPIAARRKFAIEPPKTTIPIERTSDAIQRKTEKLLQPVRTQPGEGVREMPVTERLEEAGQRGEPTPTKAGEQPPPEEGTAALGDVISKPAQDSLKLLEERINSGELSNDTANKIGLEIKSPEEQAALSKIIEDSQPKIQEGLKSTDLNTRLRASNLTRFLDETKRSSEIASGKRVAETSVEKTLAEVKKPIEPVEKPQVEQPSQVETAAQKRLRELQVKPGTSPADLRKQTEIKQLASQSTTAHGALKSLVDAGHFTGLNKLLADRLVKLGDFGLKHKIGGKYETGTPSSNPFGMFDQNTNTVHVYDEAFNSLNGQTSLLHEYVHGLTHKAIASGLFKDQLKSLYFAAAQKALETGQSFYGVSTEGLLKSHLSDRYLHEFVAEAMSSEKFQKFLESQKSPLTNRSLRHEFVSWVRKVLGIKEGTSLDDSLNLTMNLIDAQRRMETPTGDVPAPKTPTTESIRKAEQSPKPTGPPPTNAATDQDRMIGVHFNEANGPPQSRTLGIVSSITPTFTQAIKTVSENVKNAFPWVREHWREAAMLQAPKLTDLNREAGESGVRFASSFLFGRQHGLMFAEKVLDGLNVKAEQFGVALSEDNLRDLRRSYTEEARKLGESGKLDEANQIMEQANAVQTLIGKKNSPFKTEDQYQEFLNRDDVKEAIRRHIQLWKEQKDPMYRKANDLDPETPLATRGLQTGARINLKAVMEGDKPIHGVGLPRFRQLITMKRRDPFARRATGAGKVYEGNYHELMANGFEREMPVATQHEFYKKLIDTGIGKVQSKEFVGDLTINGEATKAILLKLNPWRNQWLHVPLSVFEEVKTISGLDQQPQLKVFKKFNDLMTGLSIQGLAEGTTHASNLLTQVFTGLGPTSNPMINAMLKSVGRSDLLITLPRVLAKSFSNQREAMLKLAEIGAAKTPYTGRMGWLLNRIDQGVRLVSSENYKQMAEAGWVENTETGLREYVNQVGNYNKRLQPYLIRKLRETGIQPFATAMQTFNIMGVRRLAMAPGAKASSNAAALALRADIAAGWLGTLLIPAMINTLISGKPSGVEGTEIGAIGWKDDKGKLQQLNILRIAGFERGARITGIKPAIEAYRKGLGHRHAAEAALTSIGGTGMRTVAGPGPEFLYMSATGKRIGLPMIQTAPAAPPTDSMSPFKNQFAMNVQQALIEASPLANSTYDFWHNKDWSEIGKRQLTRFWPTSGMTEEMQRALPKILERKDAVDYGDWLAKQAKKKPMQERATFVNEQLKKDKVEPRFLKAVYEEVRKKGTYKYQ